VEHRHDVVVRRTQYELKKAEDRAHLVEGLIIASDNIDEVVAIIKSSKTVQEAIGRLMERFGLSEVQANYVVQMQLRQLTGLMQEKLRAEYEELLRMIEHYKEILGNLDLRMQIIKEELLEVKEKYGDARRTQIVYASEEFNPEDFYANDEMVITISHLGYIKRTPLADYKAQRHGGMGSKGGSSRDADFIEYIYTASMHNTMLFFTQQGRCYWLKVYEIPEGNKTSKGRAIQNLLTLANDDKVTAFIRIEQLQDAEFNNSHYLLFCTKQGVVKKTLLEAYSRPRQNGVNAITIRENDSVIQVLLTDGTNEVLLANRNGRAIRFNESKVREMGRTATGVRGMQLDEDGQDEVVGMIVVNPEEADNVMVVSENGYGKRSGLDDYRVTNRGGKGVKTLNITEKTGKLVAILKVNDNNDLMIINKSGITIRFNVSSLRVMGRATQGVRLINLERRGEEIASVCVVEHDNEEETVSVDAEALAEAQAAFEQAGEELEVLEEEAQDSAEAETEE
jgi:DNA gyrase subunit A